MGEAGLQQASAGWRCIGRRDELATLLGALADSRKRRGATVAVAGEAGIGKTRLVREFAAQGARDGACVLFGRCFEGEWQPALAPWLEAAAGTPEGVGALTIDAATPGLGADEARFRLFEAVTGWLLRVAERAGVVVILDDLHWADGDSLRLLRHVARATTAAPVLLVGTCRTVDPPHERRALLVEVLLDLRRESAHRWIDLSGLTLDETAELAEVASGARVPQPVVDAVHADTGGNPFFVIELLRELAGQGKLQRRGDRWSTDFSVVEIGMPAGVRQMIDHRLRRLSDAATRVLEAAAVLRGPVQSALLAELAGLDEQSALAGVDEAVTAGLLEPVDGAAGYRFAHAILQRAIAERQGPDRRVRLYRRAAQLVAALPSTDPGEVAWLYHASRQMPGAAAGIEPAVVAAETARDFGAHDHAAGLLALAAELAGEAPPERRAEVLCRLAVAQADALRPADARATADRAIVALADAGSSTARVSRFLADVARALKQSGADHALWEPLVERGLAAVDERDRLTWARLELLRERVEPVSGAPLHIGRWVGPDPRAVAVARTQGGEQDRVDAALPFAPRTPQETEELLELARRSTRPAVALGALDVVARDLLYRRGDPIAARDRLTELLALSERYGSVGGRGEALAQLALCHGLLGELERAKRALEQARDWVRRLGTAHRLHAVDLGVSAVLAYLVGEGPWAQLGEDARRLCADPATGRGPLGVTMGSLAALTSAMAGERPAARRCLERVTAAFEHIEPTAYAFNGAVWIAGSAVWQLGDQQLAKQLDPFAQQLADLGLGAGPARSQALTLGRLAVLQGMDEQAAAWFGRAREELASAGIEPLAALADLDQATALARRGAPFRTRAGELRSAAATTFAELGMTGWQQRSQSTPVPVPRRGRGGLTAREAEVLALLAAGLTNAQIAARLVLSVATVQRHLANIYAKIGARGRADATRYAVERGIVTGARR